MPEWSSRRRKALGTPAELRKQPESFQVAGCRASDPNCGASQTGNRRRRRAVGAPHTPSPPPPPLPRADVPQVTSRDGPPCARPRARARAGPVRLRVGAVGSGAARRLSRLSRAQVYHGLARTEYVLQTVKETEQQAGCEVRPQPRRSGDRGWRIAHELEASLGYIASFCLKYNHNIPKQQKVLKHWQGLNKDVAIIDICSGPPQDKTSPCLLPSAFSILWFRQIVKHPCLFWSLPMLSSVMAVHVQGLLFRSPLVLQPSQVLVCKTRSRFSPQKVVVRMQQKAC